MSDLLKRGGPTINEIEIIGLEFALRMPNGQEVELQMFPASIIFPRSRGGLYIPRLTFHTSIGDYTMQSNNMNSYCPW